MKVKQKIKEEPNPEPGQLQVEDIKQENEVGRQVIFIMNTQTLVPTLPGLGSQNE